jgi:solute carrier family 13 (sodium-dependent dicarboxylate transporter), member 2/3/5
MAQWKNYMIGIALLSFVLFITLTGGTSLLMNALALASLMIFFWVFELVPIYVTALFPLILGVPLGVLESTDLANAYGNNKIWLFFGGFVLALGLEKWDVHIQIAKAILRVVGKSKARILLGFIIATGFISMWVSNTATAIMMMPMAVAVLSSINQKKSKFNIYLLLAIAYSASIGGMGTLVGSPTNSQMAGILSENFNIQVDFFQWMKVGFPMAVIMMAVLFGYFFLKIRKESKEPITGFSITREKWTKEQLIVSFIFLLVVVLWTCKSVIVKWTGLSYGDESAALIGAFLLFLIPGRKNSKPLLDWKDTEKLPWGILILLGGGIALAKCLEANGVLSYVFDVFQSYQGASYIWILFLAVLIAIFFTELISNTALVAILTPVVAQFAIGSGFDVLELCIPMALASSCAFMLPVGTPPNAVVFATGNVHIKQMVQVGFVLNVLGLLILTWLTQWFI